MRTHKKTRYRRPVVLLVPLLSIATACSVRQYAVNMVGDALASGNSVYESEEDIEIVGEALPFGLKLTETLLGESPRHPGLLITACQGYVLYSYAFVDYPAEVAEEEDLDRAPGPSSPGPEDSTCGPTATVCGDWSDGIRIWRPQWRRILELR